MPKTETRTLRLASCEVLTPEAARSLLAEGGQLVDVRTPAEFGRDALPGALNLPMAALAWKLRRLNRSRPVILYGRSGSLCQQAARLLASEGFTRVYHLQAARSRAGA